MEQWCSQNWLCSQRTLIFRKEAWRVLGMKVLYFSCCLSFFVRKLLLKPQPIHLAEC